jgi:hypothetical protein
MRTRKEAFSDDLGGLKNAFIGTHLVATVFIHISFFRFQFIIL